MAARLAPAAVAVVVGLAVDPVWVVLRAALLAAVAAVLAAAKEEAVLLLQMLGITQAIWEIHSFWEVKFPAKQVEPFLRAKVAQAVLAAHQAVLVVVPVVAEE